MITFTAKDLKDIENGKYDQIVVDTVDDSEGNYMAFVNTYYSVGKNKWEIESSEKIFTTKELISMINDDVKYLRKGDYGCIVYGITKDEKEKVFTMQDVPQIHKGYRTTVPKLNIRKMF